MASVMRDGDEASEGSSGDKGPGSEPEAEIRSAKLARKPPGNRVQRAIHHLNWASFDRKIADSSCHLRKLCL